LHWLFSRVDRFFYIGEANRRLYLESGVPEARLYASPYAVDNERFFRQADALRPARSELRREWGIPDDAFCVLFCGKFVDKKRPMDLVEAARRLRGEGLLPTVHLLFAGSGALGQALRRSCQVVFDAEQGGQPVRAKTSDSNLAPPASFAGFLNQTEVSQAYVAADCLVLPSDYGETWGLVVNEALASGLPCLVSDACGCAEDLAGSSFTFPLADIATLASRMLHLRLHHDHPLQPPAISESVSSVVRAYRDSSSSGVPMPVIAGQSSRP
jgi:glycosyltransferase involved in cell wall biosynthesis